MREKIEVKAVYDQDLKQVLEQLGILDKLITGEVNCAICNTLVDLDNLGAIFPQGEEISISCDNEKCIRIVTKEEVHTSSG